MDKSRIWRGGRRMNKYDIKKALKCCYDSGFEIDCSDCPYHNENRCNDTLCKDALDLITEQENEIERLHQQVRDTDDKMARNSIEQYKNDYDKAFERLKAQQREIDRLKIQLEQANAGIVNCSGCEFVETNGIKEFAEKLKQKARGLTLEGNKGAGFYIGNILLTNDIDELLKEYEK